MGKPAKEAFDCYARHFQARNVGAFNQYFKTPLPVYVGDENAIVLSDEDLAILLRRQVEALDTRRLKASGKIQSISQPSPEFFRLSAEWQFFSEEHDEVHTETVTYYVRDENDVQRIEIIEVERHTENSPCMAALKSIQDTDGGLV